jgi:hypothetical protein
MSNPLRTELLDGYGDPTDTVTHDSVPYDLNKIRKEIYYFPRKLFEVEDLKWLLDEVPWTREDEKRLSIINMKRPIFVTPWEGKLCCIDGFHRLTLAVRLKMKYLPGIMVPEEVLIKCIRKQEQSA